MSAAEAEPITSAAQRERPTSNVFDHEFDQLVEKLVEECHIPGMSIAVVYEGNIQSKVIAREVSDTKNLSC